MNDEFKTLQKFDAGNGREGFLHALPMLEEQGVGKISRLPVSIRIVLESVLRNCDGKKVRREDIETLANWNAKKTASGITIETNAPALNQALVRAFNQSPYLKTSVAP